MANYANIARIRWKYIIAGQMCTNNFVYLSNTLIDAGQAEEVLTGWNTECFPALLALQSFQATTVSRSIAMYHNPPLGIVETAESLTGFIGGAADPALPSFVTATMRIIPDNDSRLPITAAGFTRPGRIPVSGIPESAQANSGFEAAFAGLLGAACLAVEEFTATTTEGSILFQLGMSKVIAPPATPTVEAIHLTVTPGRIGSQNTRKS